MSSERPRGILLIVSSPSGAGKTTLCNRLRQEFPKIGFSVSYTTRAPRPGETDGVEYNFVSAERFQEMASDGLLDEEEMDELLAMMRQNGLDADGIQQIFESLKGEDSSVRLDDADKLKFMIETRIDNAQDLFSDSQSDLNFQIQMAVSDYTHGNEAASTLSKREHDTYMAVIRNMVG